MFEVIFWYVDPWDVRLDGAGSRVYDTATEREALSAFREDHSEKTHIVQCVVVVEKKDVDK